jgi:hypothetical protein
MYHIPPSRIKLAAISFVIVIGLLTLNKLCTGDFMPSLVEFNDFITPNFDYLKQLFW